MKRKKKIDWTTAYAQRKLDGQRMMGKKDTTLSRKNVEITTLDHIKKQLFDIINFIDGELYKHGEAFQDIMKLIKKYRKNETEIIDYYVYDMISDKPFIERSKDLKILVDGKSSIIYVKPTKVNSKEEFILYNDESVRLGYEGSMLRWGNEGYEINKRSSHLLKFKQFMDLDAIIINIVEEDANPEFGKPVLTFTHKEGKFKGKTVSFDCGCRLNHEDRKELLENKLDYIGKTANIRHFDWTDIGKPRFPVYIGIHLDR